MNLKKTIYPGKTYEEVKSLEIQDHLKIKGTNKFKYLRCTMSKYAYTETEMKTGILKDIDDQRLLSCNHVKVTEKEEPEDGQKDYGEMKQIPR